MPDPLPERPDLDDYLRHDDIIDHDDPLIEEAAEQITEGLRDNISKAQAIYEFVRDHIFHSFHINATSITPSRHPKCWKKDMAYATHSHICWLP